MKAGLRGQWGDRERCVKRFLIQDGRYFRGLLSEEVVMDRMFVSPQNSYLEALSPYMKVFRGGAFGR